MATYVLHLSSTAFHFAGWPPCTKVTLDARMYDARVVPTCMDQPLNSANAGAYAVIRMAAASMRDPEHFACDANACLA